MSRSYLCWWGLDGTPWVDSSEVRYELPVEGHELPMEGQAPQTERAQERARVEVLALALALVLVLVQTRGQVWESAVGRPVD